VELARRSGRRSVLDLAEAHSSTDDADPRRPDALATTPSALIRVIPVTGPTSSI
jgi:hypothetical protein